MDLFVIDLKKDVQCSLCNDTLIEPKILPCFHTFCKLCIKRHAELIEEINVFKCPRCSTETYLLELSSVDNLQPSLLHSRVLKGLSLVEGRKVCSLSESHSPASWYCFDCDRSLCDDCERSHTLFIKDHKVVRLADLKKEDIELIITRENHCKTHPNQRLELLCEDCDTVICVTCWKQEHKDHKTMSLDKFSSIKKAVLSKHLQVLEHLRLDEKKQQEKIANTIKQQGEKAMKEVKDKTKKIIEMLQENELELLRQIDEKLDTATRNLNIIHHIQAVIEHINNVMERGLASEIINIQETQCSDKFIFSPIPLSSRIVFVPNEKLVQQVNSGLGKLKCNTQTDHTMSTIQVESQSTEALRPGKMRFTPKTATGKISVDPNDVIDVKISPKDDVKMGKKHVRTDGKIEVEFMAKVAGQLTAEVKVNGNHVSNSPLVIIVKPQQMRITGEFNRKGIQTGSHTLRGISVTRDNCRIAVADFSSHCVHVFNTAGDILLTYGSQERGQENVSPCGVAFLNDTDLVIADWGNARICIVNTTTGNMVKTFGNKGNRDGEFSCPNGVHVDDDGNIIVCDYGNHRVQVFTREGDYQYQFGLAGDDKFSPMDVITHGGLFYVSDDNNHVIHVFEKNGAVPTRISTIGGAGSAGGQLNRPWGLAIDIDDHLLVCDQNNNCIQKLSLDGGLIGNTCDVITDPVLITILKDGQLLVATLNSGVYFVK